ncbi:MAG: ribosomal protein S18-alanine N-acetyltransferase [Leptospirales bacterium]
MEEPQSEESISPGDFRVVSLNVAPWPDLLERFFEQQTDSDRADYFLGQALMSEIRMVSVARYFGLLRPKGPGLVGFMGAWFIEDEAELHNIYLAPTFRRKGLGNLFLQRFLLYARGEGARKVYLEVRRSNSAARFLYEQLEFQVTGVRSGYYTEPREDAILMTYDVFRKMDEGRGETVNSPVLMEGALSGTPLSHYFQAKHQGGTHGQE